MSAGRCAYAVTESSRRPRAWVRSCNMNPQKHHFRLRRRLLQSFAILQEILSPHSPLCMQPPSSPAWPPLSLDPRNDLNLAPESMPTSSTTSGATSFRATTVNCSSTVTCTSRWFLRTRTYPLCAACQVRLCHPDVIIHATVHVTIQPALASSIAHKLHSTLPHKRRSRDH